MKEKIRLVRNLLEKRRARRKEQRFVVEGPHLVEEAGDLIDFVIYSEELPIVAKLRGKGIDCYKISRKQFAEISEVETPQGILAVVREQQFGLRDVLGGLIVFCIGVQDPGNLGTIIRTADAVAASGVVLSRGTVDLYNSKVIRSTMGSLFHLPIVHVDDVPETIEYLKSRKTRVVATDIEAEKNYFAVDYKGSTSVLIGNEGAGLPEEIINLSDEVVKIPMPGKAESLNVGVSTAVVLYEALRQRYAR
jgi:TrmH family RNA methyltransferase